MTKNEHNYKSSGNHNYAHGQEYSLGESMWKHAINRWPARCSRVVGGQARGREIDREIESACVCVCTGYGYRRLELMWVTKQTWKAITLSVTLCCVALRHFTSCNFQWKRNSFDFGMCSMRVDWGAVSSHSHSLTFSLSPSFSVSLTPQSVSF